MLEHLLKANILPVVLDVPKGAEDNVGAFDIQIESELVTVNDTGKAFQGANGEHRKRSVSGAETGAIEETIKFEIVVCHYTMLNDTNARFILLHAHSTLVFMLHGAGNCWQ